MKTVITGLLLVAMAFPVYGAPETFTGEADFRGAINTFDEENTVDFESQAAGDEISDGGETGGIRFDYSLPENLIIVNDSEWDGTAGNNILGVSGDRIFLSGDSVSFVFSEPVNAFGLHIIGSPGDIEADDFRIVTDRGDVSNGEAPDLRLADQGEAFFVGLVEDGSIPFSSARLESKDAEFEFHIDNIVTARSLDGDGDGYINVNHGGDDCDDSNPEVHPDGEDLCGDGVDQNCDGADTVCPETSEPPNDNSGGSSDNCFIKTLITN